jgi:hypothetical protein
VYPERDRSLGERDRDRFGERDRSLGERFGDRDRSLGERDLI